MRATRSSPCNHRAGRYSAHLVGRDKHLCAVDARRSAYLARFHTSSADATIACAEAAEALFQPEHLPSQHEPAHVEVSEQW